MSENNVISLPGSPGDDAHNLLIAALRPVPPRGPLGAVDDVGRWGPVIRKIDGDEAARLAADVSDGALSARALEAILIDLERADARERVALLRPAVEPLEVSVAALGEFDVDAVDTDPVQPRGPYLDGLLPEVGLTHLAGPAGLGKTWLALEACHQAAAMGRTAVYLDLDGNGMNMLARRALSLGADRDALRTRALNLVDPVALAGEHGRATGDALRGILRALESAPPAVLIADSYSKVQAALDGGDDNSTSDANLVFNQFALLRRESSVVILDHTGHEEKTRPRGSSGKIDTADYVVVLRELGKDDSRDADAIVDVKLHANKDRGHTLAHHLAGLAAAPGGGVHLGRFAVLRTNDPSGPQFRAVVKPAAIASGASARNAAARAAACDKAVYDAGPAGLSVTKLVTAIVGMGALAMSRRAAQSWATKYLDGRVAEGAVDKQARGGGHVYAWIGAVIPTGDADDDHHAFINELMGGGDEAEERSDDEHDDAEEA